MRHVWWLGSYEATLKELIWQVKYQRQRSTARQLGVYLAERLPYLPAETLVVPIPTASSRIRRRGYDQAEVIAEALANKLNLTYQRALARTGQKELVGKRRVDRQKMMQNAFRVKPKACIKGKQFYWLMMS